MCYYIGIEDLAANALIEVLRKVEQSESSRYVLTLKELEKYGNAVVRFLNKKNEKALLILSRASTTHMFRNYSDYFEEIDTNEGTAIALQEGKTIIDLEMKFRTYIALDLINAFTNAKVVSKLNAKVRS